MNASSKKLSAWIISTILFSALMAPGGVTPFAPLPPEDGEELSGGDTTVFDTSPTAFSFPARNIQPEPRAAFFVGRSFFKENWIVAPASPGARDGLGPLFNTRSCSACHANDGRGRPPEANERMVTMLMRVSLPAPGPQGEPLPDPTYGGQIQGQSIPGVPPEADAFVDYVEEAGQFGDGTRFSLRKPTYSLRNLGYGPLAKGALLSPRVSPGMIGMGLLEAVPEETLRALAARQKIENRDIAGRINFVWNSVAGKKVAGRFGWKAEQPTVLDQVTGAFNEDMGLTSARKPNENYSAPQSDAARQPSGGNPEVSDRILGDVAT